jgi:flagellar hook protein FlgE
MLDSIYIAASGLSTHQGGLKVISSNVANMNSPGYKGLRNQFTDVFLRTGTETGQQQADSGSGVDSLPPMIDFRSGELRETGRDLDAALDGPGFFVVQDLQGNRFYTKTGRFELNSEDKLVTLAEGYEILGASIDSSAQPIDLSSLRLSAYRPTTKISLSGNLSGTAGNANSAQPDHTIDEVKVYDAMGAERKLQLQFEVADDAGSLIAGKWNIKVLEDGKEISTATIEVPSFPDGSEAPRFSITLAALDGQSSTIDVSLEGVTGYSMGTTSTLAAKTVDGNAAGTLSKAAIDASGAIQITYTNGQTATGPKLAVAEFASPEVLTRKSGAMFTYSGPTPVRFVSLGDGTKLKTASVELSNVDLTDQFSTMILIQRGFQASSQVLSTANEMIQALYDLRSRR